MPSLNPHTSEACKLNILLFYKAGAAGRRHAGYVTNTLSTFVFHLHMVNTHLQCVKLAVSKYSCWVACITLHIHCTFQTQPTRKLTISLCQLRSILLSDPGSRMFWRFASQEMWRIHILYASILFKIPGEGVYIWRRLIMIVIFFRCTSVFSAAWWWRNLQAYSRPAAGAKLCDP